MVTDASQNKSRITLPSLPYVHKFKRRQDEVQNGQFINVQSIDTTKTTSHSGSIHEVQNISIHNESRKNNKSEIQEGVSDVNIEEIENEVLLSPAKISEIVNRPHTQSNRLNIEVDVHSSNQECLNTKPNKNQENKLGFFKKRRSIGDFINGSAKQGHRGPLPTPVHEPFVSLRNPRSRHKNSINATLPFENESNLDESRDIYAIVPSQNGYHNFVSTGIPLEVEDLRRLPKLPRSPNYTSLPQLTPPEDPSRTRLSFLATEEIIRTKSKLNGNLNNLDAIEPAELIGVEDLECWMSRLPYALQQAPLNNILIPGI